MLALEWYRSTPLPNGGLGGQALGSAPGLTDMSRRMLAAFDAGYHCDFVFHTTAAAAAAFPAAVTDTDAAQVAGAVRAHRIVLSRNPQLSVERFSASAVAVVEGMRTEILRALVRSHYAELQDPSVDGGVDGLGPKSQLATARSLMTDQERNLWETNFGTLDTSAWLPLSIALSKEVAVPRFADCVLLVSGGWEVPAHKVMVSGLDDGHFFGGALRWPGARAVITMPEGLSQEALLPLLRLRYAASEVEMEHILEMRHFAELFDWPAVRDKCEAALESMLADTAGMDAESLLTVVAHVEQCAVVPPRLKAAALSSAVRQWSKVTELAETNLSDRQCVELSALHRIRNRDGHVCGSLEEYLYAAADDLTEWERNLSLDAPQGVRRQIEQSWQHWHQLLFEYGRMNSAPAAEKWREKVRCVRGQIREERVLGQSERLKLPEGRVWFEASADWQEVPKNAVCPGGLEYRFDMQTGRNFARMAY